MCPCDILSGFSILRWVIEQLVNSRAVRISPPPPTPPLAVLDRMLLALTRATFSWPTLYDYQPGVQRVQKNIAYINVGTSGNVKHAIPGIFATFIPCK
jgi:hypothetical protein